MSKEIKIKIDGMEIAVPEGTLILDAAKKANVNIPTLCYHKDLTPTGACGMCVVDIGAPTLKRACITPIENGMEVITHSKKVINARKTVLELIMSNHPDECLECVRNKTCELQELAENLKIDELPYERSKFDKPLDTNGVIIRDPNKCILCGRCVAVCQEVQTVYALEFANRGFDTTVKPFMDNALADTVCTNCGQCTNVCPVGALYERSDIDKVWDAINDPTKHVVVQEAPAVRVAIGEPFGLPVGTVSSGKMHTALKRLGFDMVFDTNFSADLTIMEEGTEVVTKLLKALKTNDFSQIPVVTSCSPGWVKFMETYFPNLKHHVSSAKSPQQMFGTLVKTYYAEKANIDAKNIVSVSIMPCTAKKFEADRPEMKDSGYQDVDYVLTTREFSRMIKQAGIDFVNLPEEEAAELMGFYTGAGTIFGASGGVMEAALRTAYFVLAGKDLENMDIMPVRGLEGIKEASVMIPLKEELQKELGGVKEFEAKVAVAHGLGNARKLMEIVDKDMKEKGVCRYHFIEIMACPGGCVGGGGQPYGMDLAGKGRRAEGLYKEDKEMLEFRCSHYNKAVNKAYEDYLGAPYSEKAHKLLHTKYVDRSDLK